MTLLTGLPLGLILLNLLYYINPVAYCKYWTAHVERGDRPPYKDEALQPICPQLTPLVHHLMAEVPLAITLLTAALAPILLGEQACMRQALLAIITMLIKVFIHATQHQIITHKKSLPELKPKPHCRLGFTDHKNGPESEPEPESKLAP